MNIIELGPIELLIYLKEINGEGSVEKIKSSLEHYLTCSEDKDLLVDIYRYIFDVTKVFNINKLPLVKNHKEPTENFKDYETFKNLLDKALSQNMNDALKKEFTDFLNQQTFKVQELLYSIVTNKPRFGYSEKLINEIGLKVLNENIINTFNVMLADGLNEKKSLPIPIIEELKLNGWRIVSTRENGKMTFQTRNGNVIKMPEDIIRSYDGFPDGIYDGEIELKDEITNDDDAGTENSDEDRLSLASFASRLQKGAGPKDFENIFKISLFDYVPLEDFKKQNCDLTLLERKELLKKNVKENDIIKINPYNLIGEDGDIEAAYKYLNDRVKWCLSKGYEGLVLKIPHGGYTFDRSMETDKKSIYQGFAHWIKIKLTYSATMSIVGMYYGKEKSENENKVGGLIIASKDGEIIQKVGSGLNKKAGSGLHREELLELSDRLPLFKNERGLVNFIADLQKSKCSNEKEWKEIMTKYKDSIVNFDKFEDFKVESCGEVEFKGVVADEKNNNSFVNAVICATDRELDGKIFWEHADDLKKIKDEMSFKVVFKVIEPEVKKAKEKKPK